MKKLRDIKNETQEDEINLRDDPAYPKKEAIKKDSNRFPKKNTPFTKIEDIKGGSDEEYIYVKGKKLKAPRYMGGALKIAIYGFLIIFVINSINAYYTGKELKASITEQAQEGYEYLLDAGKSATKIEFAKALEIFDRALDNFNNARDQLWFISTDETFYVQNESLGQAVNALTEGGKNFAVAGNFFLQALDEFNKIPIYFVAKNSDPDSEQPSITDALKLGLEHTDSAIAEITQASERVMEINPDHLPDSIGARVTFAKSKITEVTDILHTISNHFPAILKLLGDRYPHRYLVLLQNNNEIRPSGGFIGSYAIVDVDEGYISNIDVQDVYKLDNAYGDFIKPPDEFLYFTNNWRLRDSNHSPDFAVSAANARWFMQKEGGPTVDTVIAINQGLLRDMLEITGPVQVGSFGKLNSENYNLLLSYIIEGKVWGSEDPKHILKVFIPAFKEAILKEEHLSRVGSKLYRALQQKHIMFYSPDPEIQALFDALSISGRTHRSAEREDYLSVVKTSMGGTKTEPFIEEKITHDTFIAKNGELTNKVKITRSHNWNESVFKDWQKILNDYGFTEMSDDVFWVLGRGHNKVGMRIYVPEGSKLIESDAASISTKFDKDLDKTYFFVVMETKAGETSELNLTYTLPFDLSFPDHYKLVVEKQPGSRGSIFTKTLETHDSIENLALYPEDARIDQFGDVIYATNLVYDKYFAGVWTR